MTERSEAIAQGIANRRRETPLSERLFLIVNAAADGVGAVRMAIVRTVVRAADGIGFLREKATVAAVDAHNVRVEKAEDAAVVIPKAIRRRWTKALKKMGKDQVRFHLDQGAHLPANVPFLQVDTGLKHGGTRFPTRDFAIDWADDAPDVDGDSWRGVMIAVTFLVIGAGVLLVGFM